MADKKFSDEDYTKLTFNLEEKKPSQPAPAQPSPGYIGAPQRPLTIEEKEKQWREERKWEERKAGLERESKMRTPSIDLEDPAIRNRVMLGVLLAAGGSIIAFLSNPLFGAGLIIIAAVLIRKIPGMWPFLGVFIGVLLSLYMNIIIGLAVMIVSIAASLISLPGRTRSPTRILIMFSGLGVSLVFASATTRGNMSNSILMAAIACGIIFGSWVAGSDMKGKGKLVLGSLGFAPLVLLGVIWAIFAGGVLFGNVSDLVQYNLREGLGLGTGGLFDMILNPKLATQMFLKPPTVREQGSGPVLTPTLPSVSFTSTGQVIPQAGCYDTSLFQIIARVKNTGNVYIKDIDVWLYPEVVGLLDPTNPCDEMALSTDSDNLAYNTPSNCKYQHISIPQGSTTSETCLAKVQRPMTTLEEGEGLLEGLTVAKTHTCFVNIFATTGYHSVARLPVEVIESNYARSQYEQGKLRQATIPTTVGQGPIELSLGGFEQPVWAVKGATIALLVSLSNTGNGVVANYYSLYLYIPDELLDKDNPCGEGSQFTCVKDIKAYTTGYQPNLVKYMNSNKIGNYEQIDYDDSYESLIKTHHLCFYNQELDPNSLMSMGLCVLKLRDDIIDPETTRKTFVIRGDVLYTYQVKGSAQITVRDCEGAV